MRKLKIVNKERFMNFIGIVSLTMLLVIAIKNPTKGTIEQWHDAVEEGASWNEYVRGNN
jgi:hypothetical protein